jgi:hypothetical protein
LNIFARSCMLRVAIRDKRLHKEYGKSFWLNRSIQVVLIKSQYRTTGSRPCWNLKSVNRCDGTVCRAWDALRVNYAPEWILAKCISHWIHNSLSLARLSPGTKIRFTLALIHHLLSLAYSLVSEDPQQQEVVKGCQRYQPSGPWFESL